MRSLFKKNNSEKYLTLQDILEIDPSPCALLDETGLLVGTNNQLNVLCGEGLKSCKSLDEMVDGDAEPFKDITTKMVAENIRRENFEAKLNGEKESPVLVTIKAIDKKFRSSDSKAVFIVNIINLAEQKNLELKLNHSQKMQAVGQLAGGIAHDFNNLLTAMSGFCDLLLQKHPPGDSSFPDIMQIKQNVNRAANLVRQLLAFSRKQVLKPKVVDLTDILSELSNLLRRLLGEHVNLEMVHGRDLGKILADAGQIDQVAINLAVNARDAMPNGGELKIETSNFINNEDTPLPDGVYSPENEPNLPKGDFVLMKIIDSGTGMSREVLEQIFEPFYSTKEIGAGTGLGLATVYGIVTQTNGHVLVKSVEGEGTEFHVYLQRTEEKEITAAEEAAERKPTISADLTGEGTILLVEDEVPVRIFASRALTNKGYKVLEAENAEGGIEQVQQNGGNIDLIISDVIMPGMNGPEMVKEIQKMEPNLKVIFISGYTEDAFVDYVENPDDLNFLPKPFTLKELASIVKEVMNKK